MMGRLAGRLRMTEGQLDTAILAVLFVLLLSLTGLPTAERAPSTGTGAGDVPVLPVTSVPPAEGAP